MFISDTIKENIRSVVKKVYSVDVENFTVEHPNIETWGDYATNVALILAKIVKQNPMEIAKTLSYELENTSFEIPARDNTTTPTKFIEKVEFVNPGFINFTLSESWLHYVLGEIIAQGENYGSCEIGGKKTVLVEFSQPNSNKPQHIGHARNNFLGASLSNFLEFVGYKVIRSNYVGDIGVHICKSMLMYMKHGNGMKPDKKSDHFVGDFYIMFEHEVQTNPDLEKEAQELLVKLENGDKEVTALWKMMNTWVYEGWAQTYADQKITFDIWEYESESMHIGKEMAEEAVSKGLAERQGDGSIIARLEQYGLPDKILLRSDGTTVYSTKDLQLAKNGYEKYKFFKRLYVVDERQGDYFKQIFKLLALLNFPWAKDLHHVSYGYVKLPEGNMSSRKGLVVNADDVFAELINLEDQVVSNTIENRELVLRDVALSAFKYTLLKYDVQSTIVFDSKDVTRFVGNTGPYLLYTQARAHSILEKSGTKIVGLLSSYPENLDDKELALLRSLYRFPEVVLRTAEEYAPNLMCNYLFDLAQRFNTFYNDVPILSASSAEEKEFRLLLTKSVQIVMCNGLRLLGIPAPAKM